MFQVCFLNTLAQVRTCVRACVRVRVRGMQSGEGG